MAAVAKPDTPTPGLLRRLLRYEPETGKLYWRERPSEMFAAERYRKIWNTRFADKEAGYIGSGDYRQICMSGRMFLAHRIAWVLYHGAWPSDQLDHINGDRADNRISNLRECDNATNGRNARMWSNNSSGVTGVYWHKGGQRWAANIKFNNRQVHLGHFDTIEEAAAVRREAAARFGFSERHGTPATPLRKAK
jgi:hypothetical protein